MRRGQRALAISIQVAVVALLFGAWAYVTHGSRTLSLFLPAPDHVWVNLGAIAASGALWGTLIGMLFLMPIAGLAIGAGTGALAGKLADVGIDDDTIRQIGQQLQQGKAAVFVLARSATTDRVIEAIKPFNPTVIQTSLSHDREEELVRAHRS